MVVKQAIPGKAFDVDQQLSGSEAAAFVKAGYLSVGRYIPRTPALAKGNLTALEIEVLLTAGLSIFCVQHVAEDNWMPSAALGTQYGQYGATYAKAIGLPAGVSIFLDLEMVNTGATVEQITDYCNEWFNEIQLEGYTAGLYVGWQTGLSSQQLYDLPFKSYWRGYNADIAVATRGYQILQAPAKNLNGISFDPNEIWTDKLGGLPILLYPS